MTQEEQKQQEILNIVKEHGRALSQINDTFSAIYDAGYNKAVEIYQQGGNTIVATEEYQKMKEKADKWDALIGEVHEMENGEENAYLEDYGNLLITHLEKKIKS